MISVDLPSSYSILPFPCEVVCLRNFVYEGTLARDPDSSVSSVPGEPTSSVPAGLVTEPVCLASVLCERDMFSLPFDVSCTGRTCRGTRDRLPDRLVAPTLDLEAPGLSDALFSARGGDGINDAELPLRSFTAGLLERRFCLRRICLLAHRGSAPRSILSGMRSNSVHKEIEIAASAQFSKISHHLGAAATGFFSDHRPGQRSRA